MKKKFVLAALVTALFAGTFLSAQLPNYESVWVECPEGYMRICQQGPDGCGPFIMCQ